MSSIFVFPGQGAQSVGMGKDLYENNAAARAVFDEMDDVLNEKLSNIINWVADKTFGIYLIHYLLLAKIDLYKFDKIGNFAYELIYLAVGLVVIFALSLLIVCLLRGVKNTILKLCNILKLKKQKTN